MWQPGSCSDPVRPTTSTTCAAHLIARLADFKVPRRLVLVDSLPRNDGGKVLKRALVASADAGPGARGDSEEERDRGDH